VERQNTILDWLATATRSEFVPWWKEPLFVRRNKSPKETSKMTGDVLGKEEEKMDQT